MQRIVPDSGQILIKTQIAELSHLNLKPGDFVDITIKKLRVLP